MKTYVLMLSKYFPANHPCKGNLTHFEDKILAGKKLHTIRDNDTTTWTKRAKEVNEGHAIISVREWTGKPYNSITKELFTLGHKTKFEPIFIDLNTKYGTFFYYEHKEDIAPNYVFDDLAKNDGLTLDQFFSWFNPLNKNDVFFDGMIVYFNDIIK